MSPARPLCIFAFAWALLAAFATASAADFQVPPTPHRYVVDAAGALDEATQTALESELRSFEKATGHQVVVYVGDTTGDVPLETYTAQTAHTWKIGRKGKDDGAVLFMFMDDHKVRVEVGYGLEGTLTDAAAQSIIDTDIVPRMRAGDANAAVTAGVAGMLAAIDPSFAPTATAAPIDTSVHTNAAGLWFLALFLTVFFVPWIILGVVTFRKWRRGELVSSRGDSKSAASKGGFLGWSSGSHDDSSSSSSDSSSDDDFDSGGGDFGGGGASGSW